MAAPKLKEHPQLVWAWANMKKRCTTPTKDASRYLDRGITWDKTWDSFAGFYADMGSSYRSGLTLDRIDNDKGYHKGNCRWATMKQQQNNKENNRRFTIRGVTKTFAQWIETSKLKPSTVRQRFYCYGWSIEESLYTPLRGGK